MSLRLKSTLPALAPLLLAVGIGTLLVPGCRGEDLATEDAPKSGPYGEVPADELFDRSTIPVLELTLPEEEWEDLEANAQDEIYQPANLSFDGDEIGEIAVRFKGAFGSLVLCFDEAGNLICPKLSMKLKFSEYDADKRFFGLKRVNLHAMVRDDTKLKEKIAYGLFREMGVEAPRSGWARLVVNGTSLGLFSLVEEIDGRFTQSHFEEGGDGNLYKEAWPSSDEESYYAERIRTNEDVASHETFLAFSEELRGAASGEQANVLAEWMDLDALYRYMAVNDAILNWDGVTGWYCSDYGCGSHNYYFYQHENEDRFTLVPWDLDATLTPSTPFDHIPHWTDPGDCSARYTVFGTTEAMSAGCDPLFQALAEDRGRFEDAISDLLAGPFQVDELSEKVDEYAAFIEEEIAADPTMNGTQSWLANVERLKGDLAFLVEKISALRDGRTLAPLTLSTLVATDFEEASPLELSLGMTVFTNPASTARGILNGDDTLAGSQDLRMDFTFRDEGDQPWAQWGVLGLLLEGGESDLSEYEGIRLTLRADATRPVRIDLESNNQSGAMSGAKFGWDVQGTAAAQEVILTLADAAIPSWASPVGDDKDLILQTVRGLTFSPLAIGRDASGLLGEGVEDMGHLQVDNIEFF